MKAQRGSGGIVPLSLNLHLVSTSALHGGGWSASRSGRFIPGKETQYALRWRLVGPMAGLHVFGDENIAIGIRTPVRPASSLVALHAGAQNIRKT
jgi:hypothetical protein